MVLEVLRNSTNQKIVEQKLWEYCMLKMPYVEFQNVLQGLINAGYVNKVQKGNDMLIILKPLGITQPSHHEGLGIGAE